MHGREELSCPLKLGLEAVAFGTKGSDALQGGAGFTLDTIHALEFAQRDSSEFRNVGGGRTCCEPYWLGRWVRRWVCVFWRGWWWVAHGVDARIR
jgi:hypothetical protein